MLVTLDDKLAETHFYRAHLLIVMDEHSSQLLGFLCRVIGEEVIILNESVKRLLDSHYDKLWAYVLVSEIVEA